MTDDRETIALPGGYRFEKDEKGNFWLYFPSGGYKTGFWRADQAEAFAEAMNAVALASVSPSRDGDDGLAEALRPFAEIAPHVENTPHRDGEVIHMQRRNDGSYAYLYRSDFRLAQIAYAALASSPARQGGAAGQGVSGPGAVPAGWRLVPAEPTAEMVRVGREPVSFYEDGVVPPEEIWSAMLAAAPTPAATPSGPAAVAVEEVERLLNEACGNYYQLGLDGNTSGLAGKSLDKALAAIRRLASPQDHGAVRDAALEEAALWHESQIQGGHCGEASDEIMVRQRIERHHRRSAEGIRALKTNTDQPGREGEGSDGWQPIETAPKDGMKVDLWIAPSARGENTEAGRIANCHFALGAWIRPVCFGDGKRPYAQHAGDITHWRPLPPAPSDAPQQDGEPEAGR